MFYCGVDPGQDGGVAVIDHSKKIWTLFKYDDKKFAELLCRQYQEMEIIICVEDVHAIQGAKASSTFKFGFNTGKVHGIVIASGHEPDLVTPQVWKDSFNLLYGREWDKEIKKQGSINKAKELFPGVDLRIGNRAVNEHDGMAEALLIAEWRRQQDETKED